MEAFLTDSALLADLRGPAADIIFGGFAALVQNPFIICLLACLYWLWQPRGTSTLLVLLAVTSALSALIDGFAVARAVASETSGFAPRLFAPAAIALVLWGTLAWESGHKWLWGLAILVSAGISMAGLYGDGVPLQASLAGLVVGAMVLILGKAAVPSLAPVTGQIPAPAVAAGYLALAALFWLAWPFPLSPPVFLVSFLLIMGGWWLGLTVAALLGGPWTPPAGLVERATLGVGGVALMLSFRGGLAAAAASAALPALAGIWGISFLTGFFITGALPVLARWWFPQAFDSPTASQ